MNIISFLIVSYFMHTLGFEFTNVDDEIIYEHWGLPKPHDPAANSIESAVRKYFEKRTKILNIRIQMDVVGNNWQSDFTDNLIDALRNSPRLTYKINIQNSKPWARMLYYNNLFYVNSRESLLKTLPNFRGDRGNFAGNYMILMQTPQTRPEYEQDIEVIFQKLFEIDIVNVNIIAMNSTDGPHALYSYEIFKAGKCRETQPKIVNYFANGSFRKSELFPPKLKNFNQCNLKFLSRNVPPFFNYDRRERVGDEMIVHGFEADMIDLMAAYFNFTPVLSLLPKAIWGDVYANGTVTGPFKYLLHHSVDLLLGFFAYEPQRMRRFGQTKPYILSPVIAVVNRKREITEISTTWFLDPYEPMAWWLLLGTMLAAFALLALAYQTKLFREIHCDSVGKQKYPTWLEALGNALGTACTIPDGGGHTILRICILTWGIGFMICQFAYQAKLFVAYNRLDTNVPMKLDELKHSNYTFLVRETFSGSQLLEEVLGVTDDRIVRVATNDANDIYDQMANHSGKVATLATHLRVIYYMLDHGYYDLMYTLPEILRIRQICVYFRSHSYLIQPFNNIIGKLMDCGLLSKWYLDTEYDLNKKYFHLMDSRLSTDAKPLVMATFRRVFLAYTILLCIAVLTLLVELGIHALKPKLSARKRHFFWLRGRKGRSNKTPNMK